MEELKNIWGLEYSFSENSFFSAPLLDLIKQNHEALEEGFQHDFILVAVYDSKDTLEEMQEEWAGMVDAKILYRDINGNLNVKPPK